MIGVGIIKATSGQTTKHIYLVCDTKTSCLVRGVFVWGGKVLTLYSS